MMGLHHPSTQSLFQFIKLDFYALVTPGSTPKKTCHLFLGEVKGNNIDPVKIKCICQQVSCLMNGIFQGFKLVQFPTELIEGTRDIQLIFQYLHLLVFYF